MVGGIKKDLFCRNVEELISLLKKNATMHDLCYPGQGSIGPAADAKKHYKVNR